MKIKEAFNIRPILSQNQNINLREINQKLINIEKLLSNINNQQTSQQTNVIVREIENKQKEDHHEMTSFAEFMIYKL